MGRKTWESLGKPLPGRHNIVVTRREGYRTQPRAEDPPVSIVRDLDAALAAAGDSAEVMVIGGAEIYALALPRADVIELTRVHARPEGDTFWPDVSRDAWREIARATHPADERNDHPMTFITLARYRADASEGSQDA